MENLVRTIFTCANFSIEIDMADAAAPLNSPDAASQLRKMVYLLVLALAGTQGFVAITTATVLYSPARPWPKHPIHTPMFSANDRSRWCTVWSLAERGTYQIDEIIEEKGWDTIDKGRFQEHFYSSKPPFISTIVAGIYWVVKHTLRLNLLKRTHETVQLILLIVNWIPWLVALGLLARIGERYAKTDWGKIFYFLAAAGGTFLTPFLITLNNHSWGACGIIFSLSALLKIINDERRDGWLFAMTGFWGAFAVCCEIPAALYGVALFVFAWRTSPKQAVRCFAPAALIPLAFFFYTNWLCTGSWKPFYSNFGSAGDTFYLYGSESYWNNPHGLDKGDVSPLLYLFHCTLGHHGIFSLSPIFLLSVAAWLRIWKPHPLRTLGFLALVLTVWNLAFYLGQKHNYNYGGVTSGLRWAFWLIPFWLVSMIPALDTWSEKRWFRALCVVFLCVSVYSAAFPRNNPWQHPWLMNLIDP